MSRQFNIMAGLDFLYLKYIKNHLNKDNVDILLKFFIKNTSIDQIGLKNHGYTEDNRYINVIYGKIVEIYNEQEKDSLMKLYINFLVTIDYKHYKHKNWGDPGIFFRKIRNRTQVFWYVLYHPEIKKLKYFFSDLFSEENITDVIQKVKSEELSDSQVNSIRYSISVNTPLKEKFQHALLENFGDRFRYAESVNWDEIHKKREERDIWLLEDRRRFLDEASIIYDMIREMRGEEEEEVKFYKLEYAEKNEIRKKIKSGIIFRAIEEYSIKGSFEEFEKAFDEFSFNWYVLQHVVEIINQKNGEVLSDGLVGKCMSYFMEKIYPNIDLDKAVVDDSKSESYSITNHALQLKTLYSAGLLDLSVKEQLKLLKLDSDGYLEHYYADDAFERFYSIVLGNVGEEKFKTTVLAYLDSSSLSKYVRTAMASICGELGYVETLPNILGMIGNNRFPNSLKEILVEIAIDLCLDIDVFEDILYDIDKIEWSWQLYLCQALSVNALYASQVVAIIERSNLDTMIVKENEGYRRDRVLKLGVELGSEKCALILFSFFIKKMKMSDSVVFKAEHFQNLIKTNPGLLVEKSISVFELMVPYIADLWRNDLLLLVEELLRRCSLESFDLFQRIRSAYDSIIENNIDRFPKVTNLRTYQRELVRGYYSHRSAYENKSTAMGLIAEIME